ncbi:MAG: MerR family transcriptional regulator [Deltaproteobacteria bacterium]|nr:MerR family transcriptional regulator [Deltaproteobacteria bacterium]
MPDIPDKLFFKIGEVARLTGVKPHVLRYWETEFSVLRPQKTRTNQRLYRRREVELLLQIKQLLYQEGFTIAGANKRLKELHGAATSGAEREALVEVIGGVRRQLEELLGLVEDESERR